MGLFVKKNETGTHSPLFTLGSEKTILLVGLGNIGKEFEGTRHNIGFELIDAFTKQQEFPAWHEKKDLSSHITSLRLGDTRVIAIKPTTLMNNSGKAVQAVQGFYKIIPEQTLVVHDELDVPFGQIRTRIGGGAAGNNGIKSVIQHIGENFNRVRVGIRNELSDKIDSADFVLAKFSKEERDQFSKLQRETINILTDYIYKNELVVETRSFIVWLDL